MQTTKDFLQAVLPAQGWWFLLAMMPDGRPVQRDFGFEEVDDFLSFATWAFQRKNADVYFAVGAYEPVASGPNAGELKRVADAARWHRCLRVDIDCGEGKPYPDQRAGAAALAAFLTASGMPRPWLVDSGYGLHAYWPFTENVRLEQWRAMSEALQVRAEALGLAVDTTTTCDAARILRLPGSVNFKRGGSKPVRLLTAGPATPPAELQQLLGAVTPMAAMVPTSLLSASKGELGADQYPPYNLRGVLTQCPGMGAMLRTGGATCSEPLWKMALDLVHQSNEPDEAKLRVAHALSQGHPGYSREALEMKWAQVKRQNYQPPTCSTLGGAGMPECASCPLRATIKSPVVLGRAAPVHDDAPAIPVTPPSPPAAPAACPSSGGFPPVATTGPIQQGVFLIDPASPTIAVVDGRLNSKLSIINGIPHSVVVVEEPDANGVMQKKQYNKAMGSYRIVAAERLLDRMGKQSITAITFDRATDGYVRVEASNSDLAEARAFNKLLIAHGLYMGSTDVKNLQDKFMPEFLAQFQRIRAANQIAARCGWTDDRSAFVLGTTLYTKSGSEHVRPASAPEEMEAYHQAGDEVAWRRAFDVCLDAGPERQAVLALSLAAPLMVFTGIDGVMLNAYSPESGVGKSTLCDAVLSVWGSPNKLRKDYRDTANATFKLASVVGNLPMVVDEFTNVEGKALSDYVYTITQGREKHRLTSDSRLHTSATRWCLPTIVTSNNSVHDKLQSFRGDAVAEAARVFELRLRPLDVPAEVMGQRKVELLQLRSNYGFLGPRLVRALLQRSPEEWQRTVADRISWWDREVSVDTSDRFRSACAALVDIGCALGIALGFNFDRQAVIRVMREQWEQQQAEFEVNRRTPMDFINDYIIDNLGDFAIVGGNNSDTMVVSGRRYRGEIRGRTVGGRFHPDRVVLPLNVFRDYVRDKNGNYKALLEWMREESKGGCVERVGMMTFLDGMVQQVRTQAVAFKPSVLGAANIKLATPQMPPGPVEIPSALR